MRVLFIGDVFGMPGRQIVTEQLPILQEQYQIDFTIANAENSAGGFGINRKAYDQLYAAGVDAFTMGNHTWDNKELLRFVDEASILVRPANYLEPKPGCGCRVFTVQGKRLAVINLLGQVYLAPVANPFTTVNQLLKEVDADYYLIDFHAEATSEKMALGWFVDGRATAVLGTHTHIQTADARVLPQGCAYISDVGMTGPRDSVLGMDKEIVVQRFLTGSSTRFAVAHGDVQLNAVVLTLAENGHCQEIEPIRFWQPGV